MPNPLRSALVAAVLLSRTAFAEDAQTSTLTASAEVPVIQDRCLDHTVKELGMSAKKADTERRWIIGPQYLHSAIIKGGSFDVRLDKGEKVSVIRVTATWPGARKPADVQTELEQRIVAIPTKMAQLCGAAQAPVTCTITEPGGTATACAQAP